MLTWPGSAPPTLLLDIRLVKRVITCILSLLPFFPFIKYAPKGLSFGLWLISFTFLGEKLQFREVSGHHCSCASHSSFWKIIFFINKRNDKTWVSLSFFEKNDKTRELGERSIVFAGTRICVCTLLRQARCVHTLGVAAAEHHPRAPTEPVFAFFSGRDFFFYVLLPHLRDNKKWWFQVIFFFFKASFIKIIVKFSYIKLFTTVTVFSRWIDCKWLLRFFFSCCA